MNAPLPLLCFVLGTLACSSMETKPYQYPSSKKVDVVDTYHGVRVPDPYRWLEDADAADTVAWVDAQNTLTRSMLDGPVREQIEKRLEALYNYPRTSAPVARGGRYFYTHNSGLQNQPVLYVQEGLAAAPRTLLDPNTLTPDGTAALTAYSVTDDGRLLGYAISKSGSDRQDIFVRDVATATDRPDRISWAKFTNISWTADGSGFYYARFPEPGTVPPGDENYFHRIYFHRLGDDQTKDTLIYERPQEKEVVFQTDVTDDGRFLVITAFQGSSDKSEVFVLDRAARGGRPTPLFTGFASSYLFIDSVGSRLFFQTDERAPLGRIIAVDLAAARPAAIEVVAESPDKLSQTALVGGRLVTAYLHNASDQVKMFDLDGAPRGAIALPALGSVETITGQPGDREMFFSFTSFVHARAPYRYGFDEGTVTPFGRTTPVVNPDDYETRQVWYPSKDGTKVSMFLVHRRGLALDRNRPTLLSAYGGFNISLTPIFDPANFVWLDRGGVYALANLRGGGEYGEAWHQAGMFEKKQNVFDDFVAAAEWLKANGYTRTERLAIEGGSNGGLLVGAVMVQRPDLVGAVLCRVPVADMLRYHRFTVGRFWISEYGSADDPKQFPYLFKYSPLHNVRDEAPYPATLVTTADTDDRVAPGMAKKFAARLQEAATRAGGPVLIRVETKAGHGAGKPVSKMIDEDADLFAFLFKYLNVDN